MSGKLEPCPFCGGEARTFRTLMPETGETLYHVGCTNAISCPVAPALMGGYGTPEEAAEAWNRRAERTCRYVYDGESGAWQCGECGGMEPVCDHPTYCIDCGARVIEEEL